MKKLALLMLSLSLLAGCKTEPPKVIGQFENVTVKDKRKEEKCSRGCWDEYYVKLEKDGTEVELAMGDRKNMYHLFTKGNVVTVSYDEDYRVVEIKFPTLEGNKKQEGK